ncbi:hypothetical protein [Rhizobium tumorigenes]|uniref:AraC family transcriptional regulator n=1 Tax=Rhizobium tumorigenes TaxID=2041385 RepID=A0AAF1K8B7_9HYPH|nr:hypothetical protein [Rhizobium tumorigenes]WFR97918.1 hypothetical protein PR017_18660 [Rhizobium tumorigenes]
MAAGEKIAECFGTENARFLRSRPLRRAELSITHLWCQYDDGDNVVDFPADDAFLVVLYLIDVEHRDIWLDRPPAPIKTYPKGSICLVSLRQGATIAIRGNFEALVFHVPCALLAELADEAGEPRVNDLAVCRGAEDQTVRSIGSAILPLFDLADDVRDRLLPHVALAFNAHIAHRYGHLGNLQ